VARGLQKEDAPKKTPTMSIHRSFTQLSDVELMTQISHGSEHALEILFARHKPLLRSVAARVLGSDVDADDVLQDVFLHVWNRATDYSSEKGQPLGWLVTIARRRALDRVRQRTSYQNATTRYEDTAKHELGQMGLAACVVDDEVEHNEMSRTVKNSLNALPTAQGQVVELAFFQGLSQREIAAKLALPLGTVKTRIELGMRKLGRSLAKVA
jgi:RNA polymerase sigma-70 factor (ECF subfamily)